MGLLQRMYEGNWARVRKCLMITLDLIFSANFAMLIFCGHYPKQDRNAHLNNYPDNMDKGDGWLFQIYHNIEFVALVG